MSETPTPDGGTLRSLSIGRGYLISRDGRVFPVGGGKPVKPMTLLNARQEAAKAGGLHRTARDNAAVLVRKEPVLYALGGRNEWGPPVDHVETVRFRPPGSREADVVSWMAGGPIIAVGDVNDGWYLIDDGARGRVLFHGPSEAARIFQLKH